MTNDEHNKIYEDLDVLKDDVSGVKAQQDKWRGSLSILTWLTGIAQALLIIGVGWVAAELRAMSSHQAVNEERWTNFMADGPRFTPKHYEDKIKVDIAEVKDWVRAYIKEDVPIPPPEVEAELKILHLENKSLRSMAESITRRLEALEKKL